MRSRLAPAVLVAALAIAACAGSSGDSGTDTTPSGTEPVATEPPVTEPPATEPPATEPPVTEPPATDPPATEPPATEPPVTEPPATEPPATDPPTELAFDASRGDYQVGVATIVLPDFTGRQRDLTVDVWFPLADGVEGAPHQYTLLPGTYYESPAAIAATPDSISPDGPFPLVVYSHGSGGLRYIHSDYTEAIASNGYIVAAADHTGNTAADDLLGSRDDVAVISLDRPTDVTAVIDAFLDPTRVETVGFVSAVDPERIAVTGHSFGGFTALATASGYDNELGSYEPDTRVDAIIPLAPASGEMLLSDERLAAIGVPTMFIAGTADSTTPIETNVTRPWELIPATPAFRADLAAAQHETFTDVCSYLAFLPTLPEPNAAVVETLQARGEAGCDADDMPIERAQSITNTLAVAFLDQILKDGAPLMAEQVDEQPDVVFFARS